MKFNLRKLLGITFCLLILGSITLLIALNQTPRSELTKSLKFLKGFDPIRSKFEPQGYFRNATKTTPRQEVVALVEEFELPMSLDEARLRSRDELKPLAYVTAYHSQATPPDLLFSIIDPTTKNSVVITFTEVSKDKTLARFKMTMQPTWIELFFARIRNGFSGKDERKS